MFVARSLLFAGVPEDAVEEIGEGEKGKGVVFVKVAGEADTESRCIWMVWGWAIHSFGSSVLMEPEVSMAIWTSSARPRDA